MSEIETQVLSELAKQPELQAIERGFLWRRGEGETRLWFQPSAAVGTEFGPCATAFVETVFDCSAPNDVALARLNRRAAFGSFFSENERIGLRASYCIYEEEPASNWVAVALLRAMGEQLALGFGIFQSEFAANTLAGNRANLEYPRRWARVPAPEVFSEVADQFSRIGLVSSGGPSGLTLEVPLDGGLGSKMIGPQAETALLLVSVDTPHPLAGVGYAATIALPINPPGGQIADWCRFLNGEEHKLQDFVPRLGAWGMRGLDDELVYSMFWPTDGTNSDFVGTTMNWMVLRTLWIKNRYWSPGFGLIREKGDG